MKKNIVFLLGYLFFTFYAFAQKTASTLTQSPDGNLVVEVFQKAEDEKKGFYYSVNFKKKEVLLASQLGIGTWVDGMSQKATNTATIKTNWKPVYGERSMIKDEYSQRIITLTKTGMTDELQLIVRVYNAGVAIRYFFPKLNDKAQYLPITNESTKFTFPEETKAWYEPQVEAPYSLLPLANWPGKAEAPLALALKNGLCVVLGEADKVKYTLTKFSVNEQMPNTVYCNMYDAVPAPEGTTFSSPWRYIMVGEHAGEITEHNEMVLNLNEPCKIENTSWIKPGKSIRDALLTVKSGKKLIDFLAAHNMQYMLLDAGWYGPEYNPSSDASKPREGYDLQEVLRYAKEKNIGVWLYVNRMALEKQLDDLLPLYKSWGITGIKFGFVRVGTYQSTVWLLDAIRKCAKYNFMVDVHDEYRPTGYTRTYPNFMTQEGVRGNEHIPDAYNNTVLPFARFVAGPADYTFCYFDKRLKNTHAHQLALSVVYYSPIQHMYWYDLPYEKQLDPGLQLWDKVPTVWDDTKFLQGEVGNYATVARRSGNEWFIGNINNMDARDISVQFNFLEPGKKYLATVYEDDSEDTNLTPKVKVETFVVTSKSIWKLKLAASGGATMHLKPATGKDLKGIVLLP